MVCNCQSLPKNVLGKRNNQQNEAEEFYQNVFRNKVIGENVLSLVCNALAVDGAILIDRNLKIKGFGVIVNTTKLKSESEGARTRAAEFFSRYGLSIKISQDGPISVYRNRKVLVEVL